MMGAIAPKIRLSAAAIPSPVPRCGAGKKLRSKARPRSRRVVKSEEEKNAGQKRPDAERTTSARAGQLYGPGGNDRSWNTADRNDGVVAVGGVDVRSAVKTPEPRKGRWARRHCREGRRGR
ncbi:hypothetical protein L1887_58838 [Cichorium endivia]|nr:hypothetical protein L1887_58838 [Cichorium endivia]